MEINKTAIIDLLKNGDLNSLPVEARSLLLGLFSDGLQGLMDAAVVNNIDKIPPIIKDIVSPYLLEIDWNNVPGQIADTFNSFFRTDGPGLVSSITNVLNGSAFSNINLTDFFKDFNLNLGGSNFIFNGVRNVVDMISSGGLGGISQILSDFGGFDPMSLIPGSGIIKTASTIFGVLFKEGDLLGNLFGNEGFGITSILDAIGVGDTIKGLVAPILGLLGLGGGGSGCPCSPGCRKTDHFITEKEQELLKEEKCETVISNSSSSYYPTGDKPNPSETNGNLLSEAFGYIETQLGASIIPENILNLTAAILELPRLSSLGNHSESTQFADWPDFMNEYSYSMKTIEHGFKIADNNITGMEKIFRVILDGEFFSSAFEKSRDDQVIETLADTAQAVKELYTMIQVLDRTKRGGSGIYSVPSLAIQKMKNSYAKLIKFKTANWIQHAKKVKDFLELAMSIWKSLEPGRSHKVETEENPGSTENNTVDTPFTAEDLEAGTSRFTEDFYQALTDMVHTDVDSEIDEIFEKISLKDFETPGTNTPKVRRPYEDSLRKLIEKRIQNQQNPNDLLPDPLQITTPPGAAPTITTPPGVTPTIVTAPPTGIDPRFTPNVPVSSDPRRQPISIEDLKRLSEQTGLNDYNTLVQKLLDEQAAAEGRKENC